MSFQGKKLSEALPQLQSMLNQQLKYQEHLIDLRKRLLASLEITQKDLKQVSELDKTNNENIDKLVAYIKLVQKK